MGTKAAGLVGVGLSVVVLVLASMPAQARTFSEDCDIVARYTNQQLTQSTQKYDDATWVPTPSQEEGWWQPMDDISIPLDLVLWHDHPGAPNQVRFQWWVDVVTLFPSILTRRIYDNGTQVSRPYFVNDTVTFGTSNKVTHPITFEVDDVPYETAVTVNFHVDVAWWQNQQWVVQCQWGFTYTWFYTI